MRAIGALSPRPWQRADTEWTQSSTWFARVPCHKNFLCGSTLRLRVPGVVTLCEESREGRQHSRAEFDTNGRSLRLRPLRLRPPSSRLRLSLCPAAAVVACGHPRRGAERRDVLGRHAI